MVLARILFTPSVRYSRFHMGGILSRHSRECTGMDLLELTVREPQIALRSAP